MMSVLLWGLLGGVLMGAALTMQWATYKVQAADDSLRIRNKELEAEVLRLRTFHAMHVGEETPCRPEARPTSPNNLAATLCAR